MTDKQLIVLLQKYLDLFSSAAASAEMILDTVTMADVTSLEVAKLTIRDAIGNVTSILEDDILVLTKK